MGINRINCVIVYRNKGLHDIEKKTLKTKLNSASLENSARK